MGILIVNSLDLIDISFVHFVYLFLRRRDSYPILFGMNAFSYYCMKIQPWWQEGPSAGVPEEYSWELKFI
jgi:hypothetical protein